MLLRVNSNASNTQPLPPPPPDRQPKDNSANTASSRVDASEKEEEGGGGVGVLFGCCCCYYWDWSGGGSGGHVTSHTHTHIRIRAHASDDLESGLPARTHASVRASARMVASEGEQGRCNCSSSSSCYSRKEKKTVCLWLLSRGASVCVCVHMCCWVEYITRGPRPGVGKKIPLIGFGKIPVMGLSAVGATSTSSK